MRAAVLTEPGTAPRVADFDEPRPDGGHVVIDVRAAGLHHLDLHKASGTFYTGPPPLPSVVGTDGVGTTPDGRRVYFDVTVAPFGSMAERALVPAATLLDVAEGCDDAVAAALGNTGLGAYMALTWRGELRPGETVLVLGATGAAGAVGVQVAKLHGARRVVAAALADERLDALRDLGADAIVELDRAGDLAAAFREAAQGDVDLTLDLLWGAPGLAAMQAAGRFARHLEMGSIAGEEMALPAALIRSKSLDVRGFSIAHPPVELRREAYRRLTELASNGDLHVDLEAIPLDDVHTAWERQRRAAGGPKLVIVPTTSPGAGP